MLRDGISVLRVGPVTTNVYKTARFLFASRLARIQLSVREMRALVSDSYRRRSLAMRHSGFALSADVWDCEPPGQHRADCVRLQRWCGGDMLDSQLAAFNPERTMRA